MIRRTEMAVVLATGVLVMFPATVRAQAQPASTSTSATVIPGVTEQDIKMLREDIRGKRKQVVAANMTLSPDQATKFWPLYQQYTDEVIKINDRRTQMMKDYAVNYQHMTDEQAKNYVTTSAAVDADLIALRLKYVPQFEQMLSPKQAVQFYQIDRRLDLLLNLQLVSLIPIVNPAN